MKSESSNRRRLWSLRHTSPKESERTLETSRLSDLMDETQSDFATHEFAIVEAQQLSPPSEEEAGQSTGCMKILTQSFSLSQRYTSRGTADANPAKNSVKFSNVSIHIHGYALGDNPSVSAGPPVTIENTAIESHTINLEDYEEHKPAGRSRDELIIPRWTREEKIKHAGYSRSEINKSVELVKAIQTSRLKSLRDESFWKRLRPRFSVIFRRQKNDSGHQSFPIAHAQSVNAI